MQRLLTFQLKSIIIYYYDKYANFYFVKKKGL